MKVLFDISFSEIVTTTKTVEYDIPDEEIGEYAGLQDWYDVAMSKQQYIDILVAGGANREAAGVVFESGDIVHMPEQYVRLAVDADHE